MKKKEKTRKPRLEEGKVYQDAYSYDSICLLIDLCVENIGGEKACEVIWLDSDRGRISRLCVPIRYLGPEITISKARRLRTRAIKAAQRAVEKEIINLFAI